MDDKIRITKKTFEQKLGKYVKQKPYVGDDGIYVPVEAYVPEGFVSAYKCIITKEMFVEAYNKYIKGDFDGN